MSGDVVAIFARAPRPGHTKTRLVPALGADGAARLAAAFLADVIEKPTLAGATGPTSIWAAEEEDRALLEELGRPVRVQPAGDLGARMREAMAVELERASKVLIVGSDLPTLPPALLARAFHALDRADLVLGPATDGGYYLIGARTPFDFGANVRWSTRHALADTLAAAGDRRVALLPPWFDVDDPDDLRVLAAQLALRPRMAPATALVLSGLRPSFDRERDAG